MITAIKAQEVLDSRGNPTVEVHVISEKHETIAIVPSGASTGIYEALELRDGGKRFLGKGVLKAVMNVNTLIAKKIVGMDPSDQRGIDEAMIALDGTANKSKLGANAILGVSMAVARLGAMENNMPLYVYLSKLAGTKPRRPIPFANIINGGKHAGSDMRIQEFMIAPVGSRSVREAVQMTVETYQILKKIIEQRYGKSATNVGDEGGFAPSLKKQEEALDLIQAAIKQSGYGSKIRIAMDCAASEFFVNDHYLLDTEYTKDQLIKYYISLIKKYNIYSIEDPFSQDDFESYMKFTKLMGRRMQIIGDDLLVTNSERIRKAIQLRLCNSLLLKVNQIGTVTEAIDAARLAFQNKWKVMVSHRSGETEDTFIADLAIGLGCQQIKLGAPARGERTAKYNRLLRIEEELK